MLQVFNTTSFETVLTVLPDKDGNKNAVSVIKATFDLSGGKPRASQTQAPIVWADEYWGNPERSSLKYAAEVTLPKPSTDIVMNGHAYANGRRHVKVTVKVGSYQKTVSVSGDRFYKGLISPSFMTDPKPFGRIALIYEHTYGGRDEEKSGSGRFETWPYNPVGTGFTMSGGKNKKAGMKVPNITSPKLELKDLWQNSRPEGFGYIAPHWLPRSSFTGKFSKQELKNRQTYFPKNFNPKFYNSAHPDLITDQYLIGDEQVSLLNASRDGIIDFTLPGLDLLVRFDIDGQKHLRKPNLDTLILEPDENRFIMIYRASIPCSKRKFQVRFAEIYFSGSEV